MPSCSFRWASRPLATFLGGLFLVSGRLKSLYELGFFGFVGSKQINLGVFSRPFRAFGLFGLGMSCVPPSCFLYDFGFLPPAFICFFLRLLGFFPSSSSSFMP